VSLAFSILIHIGYKTTKTIDGSFGKGYSASPPVLTSSDERMIYGIARENFCKFSRAILVYCFFNNFHLFIYLQQVKVI